MNTSLMQPQRLVRLEELPEPAPDQRTGRQTVAISVVQHQCQFVSTAQTPPALHSPSCFTLPPHELCHFFLSLGLPPRILSQEINTWQEYSLHSITLIHFEVALGGLMLLLNCNKAGCCQNATATSNRFCFTRAP